MFKQINGIKDLVNSEGPVVRLLERTDLELDQHNLYVEALMKDGHRRILCIISPEALKLYLNGRLRLKELFLVRSDEKFIIHSGNKYEFVRYNSNLAYEVYNSLETGCSYYTELSEGMRSYNSTSEIMRIVDLFW